MNQSAQSLPEINFINEKDSYLKPYKEYLIRASTIQSNALSPLEHSPRGGQVWNQAQIASRLNQIGQRYLPEFETHSKPLPESFEYSKYYIPTLRSLRSFASNADIYLDSVVQSYFKEGPRPQIFTGLDLRAQVEDMLLGDKHDRAALAKFETYLSQSLFHGKEILLRPRKGKNVLYVKIGDDDDMAIYDLGDGIQMAIILTFPLFRYAEKPKLVFIEEPELFLHPGMQRMIIDTFLEAPNTQFFIATHSNHLLDMTVDSREISIFTLTKSYEGEEPERKAKFVIENVSFADRRPLELLGTRNSSVLITNSTIWVEGISDRRYLAHFLQLYVSHSRQSSPRFFAPKEDLHFSFVEYSGGNLTHWSVLDDIPDPINVDRLCSKLFLITDKDNASGKKEERFKKLQARLGGRYYCLQCREMENLLPEMAIVAVIKHYESDGSQLNAFYHSQYKDRYLGKFIEEKILINKTRRGSYAEESGTVSDKLRFCELAIGSIKAFTDLPDEAQDLTKRIYAFIADNNS